ncbi:CPSF A subunit region [Apiospora kogelbergensis]|uniref:CPSF A subunit region n=1 Tax=Apiospora kogelbergensis TaxID=1337665 RepID=A0AAW0QKL5_9PEZI
MTGSRTWKADHCVFPLKSKANRLEFWKIDRETGLLVEVDSKVVNGTITMLQRLRPRDAINDQLFIGTDRFHYFNLGWDDKTQGLNLYTQFYDIEEKHMRDSQSQDQCIVDPTGQFMVMLLWEGVLNVARLYHMKSKRLDVDWQEKVRIKELFIRSATFLHVETGQPKVAFLYQTRTDNPDAQLVTYRVYSDDKNTQVSSFETKDQIDKFEVQDPGAAMLIPLGGFIVVGETRLLYYDDAAKKTVETALVESSIFVAWAAYDVSHYFIGDDYGAMWLLEIQLENGAVVTGLEMKKVGTTVSPHDYALELVQELTNISPILDFTIMDMGNREGEGQTVNEYSSGQARIVAGSGVHKDGSLRSVRSGVGLEDVGILADMDNIRSLFPIKTGVSPKYDALLVSFLTETRAFTFSPTGDIEEVEEFKGTSLNEQTLVAQNLSDGRLIQVTPSIARLIDVEGGVAISSWSPAAGQTITNASANNDWIVLSVNGNSLLSLKIEHDLIRTEHNDLGEKEQVACIHLPPQYPHIGVVGFWKSGTISIMDLSTLQPLHSESLRKQDDLTSVPRDIVLAQVLPPELSGPSLFVAMEDGFVFTFNVSRSDFALSGRKSIVLGTRHARLQLLPKPNGVYNVFSTSEHSSLIYASHGRIIYSAVTAQDATCVCPFDTEAFPDCIALASEKTLKLALIDDERRTHVETLPMEQTVRRIAYSRNERAFGLGCVKREVVNNEEIITSSFRLVDEVIFGKIGNDLLLEGSSGPEMVEAVFRAELTDSYGNKVERFLVGTSYLSDVLPNPGSQDDFRGRILVVGIDSDRNPYVVTQRGVKGACRCFGVIGDYVVAALAKTVVVYRYNEISTTYAKIDRVASYRPSTYPVDLAIEGDTIAVADLMKSMSLVKFTPPIDDEPAKLEELGRHYQASWATSICHIEGESWLESDAQGNLMVLRRDSSGVTEEDKKSMKVTSEFNLGDMVNKIRKVTVDASENAIVVPRAFLGTVEGGIYLFGTMTDSTLDLLRRLQNNLIASIETVGDLEFNGFRSFRNEQREETEPYRYIDGELIERFLDADEEIQEKLVEGLGPDVESMRNLVEELKRLH